MSHAGLLRLHLLLISIEGGSVVIGGLSLDPWLFGGGLVVVTGGLGAGGFGGVPLGV